VQVLASHTFSIQQQQILHAILPDNPQNLTFVFRLQPAIGPSISARPPTTTSSTASTYTYRLFGF
jgi:hypothetical protein